MNKIPNFLVLLYNIEKWCVLIQWLINITKFTNQNGFKFQIIHVKYLSGSVKTYALMNLMHHQPNTDNMYLYVEDEPGYQ